jgi:RNA polymerase sigma factor (sigma-70 family)
VNGKLLHKQIGLVKELNNKKALEEIILEMQPLIRKYVRKLFFMEKEDASQELYIALIEAINHIKKYDNEVMCLSYLCKSIINKYNYLCKKNIKENALIDNFSELNEDIIHDFTENYNYIELNIFLDQFVENLNHKQRQIVNYFLKELSDTEISLKLGVSRQYVNRVRRQLRKEISMKLG